MKISKKSLSGLMGIAALGLFSSTANAIDGYCYCTCYDEATGQYGSPRSFTNTSHEECAAKNSTYCLWDVISGTPIPGFLDNCHS